MSSTELNATTMDFLNELTDPTEPEVTVTQPIPSTTTSTSTPVSVGPDTQVGVSGKSDNGVNEAEGTEGTEGVDSPFTTVVGTYAALSEVPVELTFEGELYTAAKFAEFLTRRNVSSAIAAG